jgi:hypothetical protein
LRSGQLTFSMHRDIMKECFAKIKNNHNVLSVFVKCKDFGEGNVRKAFKDIATNVERPLDGSFHINNIENIEGYKFLIQCKNKIGKLNDVNELVETLQILVNIISQNYSRVIISIDELENLSRATGTERFLISDFLRKIHDDIEKDLTLFLIFTFDSFEEVESLLQKAFLSRIKESIEFSFVKDQATVEEYIKDCIEMRCKVSATTVISAEVISAIADSLISTFKGKLAFRTINAEMHRVFTDTYFAAGQARDYKIDFALYNTSNKAAVSPEYMKQLTEELTKGGPK